MPWDIIRKTCGKTLTAHMYLKKNKTNEEVYREKLQ